MKEKNKTKDSILKFEIVDVIEDIDARMKFLKKVSKKVEKWFNINILLNLLLCFLIGISNCRSLLLMNIFLGGTVLIHFLLILFIDASRRNYLFKLKDVKEIFKSGEVIEKKELNEMLNSERLVTINCLIRTIYRKIGFISMFFLYVMIVVIIIIKEDVYYMIQF